MICSIKNSAHMMDGIIIREARREDCKEIRRLIQELAEFEKMKNGPKIEHTVLEEDGFNSQHPYFHCFVAEPSPEDGGDAVVPDNGASGTSSAAGDVTNTNALLGYALFYYSYSTWEGKSLYLEDLYVTPSCRGQGLGSALFNRVAKRAFETGCSRLDFAVLDWNPARVFYKEKGAIDLTEEEGWHHYRINRDVLEHISAQGVSKANVTNE